MFNKIKQLKELRGRANEMRSMLSQETVHAEGAGGKVSIVMDGNQDVLSVSVDPELLNPEHRAHLEQALREVINDAVKKSQRLMATKIQGMGGLNIPGM